MNEIKPNEKQERERLQIIRSSFNYQLSILINEKVTVTKKIKGKNPSYSILIPHAGQEVHLTSETTKKVVEAFNILLSDNELERKIEIGGCIFIDFISYKEKNKE